MAAFFMFNITVYAHDERITYEQALRKVIENTDAIKNLEDSMVYLDEIKRESISNMNDLNVSLGQPLEKITPIYTQIIKLSQAIMNYEDQISNYDMNKKILKDTAEFTLINYLINIKTDLMDIAALNEKINLDTKNLKVMKIKNKRGLASDLELSTMQNNLAQENNNLSALNIKLQNDKQALNKLMGLKLDSNVEVELNIPNEKFDSDLETYILNEMNNSPLILMKRKVVSEAQYAVDTHSNLVDEVESEPVNNLKKADREYEETKKSLEKNIRSAYNDLKSLENNKKALAKNLESVKNIYNANLIKYKAGLISENALEESKINISQVKNSAHKNDMAISNLIFRLNHSYLLGN